MAVMPPTSPTPSPDEAPLRALPDPAFHLPPLPHTRCAPRGRAALAAEAAAALAEGEPPLPGAVLLERHGSVAVGETIDEAVNRLELVEVLCRTWRDALLL